MMSELWQFVYAYIFYCTPAIIVMGLVGLYLILTEKGN